VRMKLEITERWEGLISLLWISIAYFLLNYLAYYMFLPQRLWLFALVLSICCWVISMAFAISGFRHGHLVDVGRWPIFLAIAAASHAQVAFFSPDIITPPSISEQLPTVRVAALVFLVPFVVGFLLLLRYRTNSERVIAWCSLASSLFWLVVGGFLVRDTILELP
jgi:hypothetical protein